MTYLLLTSILLNPVILGVCLWFLNKDREDTTKERDEFRRLLMALVDHQDAQRKELLEQAARDRRSVAHEAFRDRQVLMERIQRPEQIPAQAAPDPSGEPTFVPVDDDDAHWEHLKELGLNANAG